MEPGVDPTNGAVAPEDVARRPGQRAHAPRAPRTITSALDPILGRSAAPVPATDGNGTNGHDVQESHGRRRLSFARLLRLDPADGEPADGEPAAVDPAAVDPANRGPANGERGSVVDGQRAVPHAPEMSAAGPSAVLDRSVAAHPTTPPQPSGSHGVGLVSVGPAASSSALPTVSVPAGIQPTPPPLPATVPPGVALPDVAPMTANVQGRVLSPEAPADHASALVTHKVLVPKDGAIAEQQEPDPAPTLARRQARTSVTFQRRSTRARVRRVTRVVRHIDTWSVFKVALVFSVFLYAVALTAGVLLWHVAMATGTIDNVERFFEGFGWESFQFKGGEIYHSAWIAGLFAAVGLTGLAVLLATLFNLITDLVGGIRVSVLEEEVLARRDRSPKVVLEHEPTDGDLYDQARHG